jgi:hypothetical protein
MKILNCSSTAIVNLDPLFATVEKATLYQVQQQAVEIRKLFADLSPMERAAARLTKEYKAIERLVEAVERL